MRNKLYFILILVALFATACSMTEQEEQPKTIKVGVKPAFDMELVTKSGISSDFNLCAYQYKYENGSYNLVQKEPYHAVEQVNGVYFFELPVTDGDWGFVSIPSNIHGQPLEYIKDISDPWFSFDQITDFVTMDKHVNQVSCSKLTFLGEKFFNTIQMESIVSKIAIVLENIPSNLNSVWLEVDGTLSEQKYQIEKDQLPLHTYDFYVYKNAYKGNAIVRLYYDTIDNKCYKVYYEVTLDPRHGRWYDLHHTVPVFVSEKEQ